MANNQRVTLACFLAYFVMSAMLSPIGIVLPPLAEQLNQSVEAVAPIFSWMTFGILAGSALALVVFDWLSIRGWMALLYSLITAALLCLRFTDSALLLRLSLAVIGAGCGIGLAAAATTITRIYAEDHRASMLVVTDGCFSIAGILMATLAVALVGAGLHWASTYLAVAVIAALIVILVLGASFPAAVAPSPGFTLPGGGAGAKSAASRAPWPVAVWLCIAALFLYTLGQYSLLWWLPTYLEAELAVPRDEAGQVVARFWTGMLLAQLLVAWWVLRIGARRLVLLSVAGAFLGSLPLWLNQSPGLLPLLSLLWGVANLGLLKIVIAFATLAVPDPSARLVAALLFGATTGTAISPTVTSFIVGVADTKTVLQFGSLCYLLLATLVGAAWLRTAAPRAP